MFEAFIWIIIFIISLCILIKAADYFTDSAQTIGLSFGISEYIVGATIVAVGTSLPELLTGVFGVLAGSTEIVIANVVGSNITNLFLGVGIISILAGSFKITKKIISTDSLIFFGSGLFLAIASFNGIFTLKESLLCLIGFIIYINYNISAKRDSNGAKKSINKKTIGTLVVSCILLYIGAKYTIESIIILSEILNVGKEIITASAVALGTSLPEITASIILAKKQKYEMAIGTLIGSNIFNSLAIMGIAGLFGTLFIPNNMIYFGIPMMMFAIILYFFMIRDKKITKLEGLMLIFFYIFFIGKLFI